MEKGVRKTRNRNFREIELLVWLIILLAIVIISSIAYSSYNRTYEIHNLLFPDVDGIIVGSPVNMMGVSIGYVTKLKIVNDDEVLVKFVVKDKSVKLQKGTIANIEFFGLGGSKSLELYPPNSKYVQMYGLDKDNYIITKQPQRLRDSMSLLFEMYNKFTDIFYKISNFSNEVNTSNIKKETMHVESDVKNFVEFYDRWTDNMQKEIKNIRN